MILLSAEEIRLGQELYQTTSHWTPAGYEYRAKPAPVRAGNITTTEPTSTKGSTGKRPRAIQGACEGISHHKTRADKA